MRKTLVNCLARLHKDEAGQGLIEYLLIIALVAFAATAGMTSLAEQCVHTDRSSAGCLHYIVVARKLFHVLPCALVAFGEEGRVTHVRKGDGICQHFVT